MKRTVAISAGALGALLWATPSWVSARHREPPPEAAEACADLEEGDACSFDGHHGTVEGTCRLLPDSKDLACAPERLPERG
jgi:hypothetical protein